MKKLTFKPRPTQLSQLSEQTIRAMCFRNYATPELLPALNLLITNRCEKNMKLNRRYFLILITLDVLTGIYGMAPRNKIVQVTGIVDSWMILRELIKLGYAEAVMGRWKRGERPRRFYKITIGGKKKLAWYQRIYREEIFRLRDLGINFENLAK